MTIVSAKMGSSKESSGGEVRMTSRVEITGASFVRKLTYPTQLSILT